MSKQFTLGESVSPQACSALVAQARQERRPWLHFDATAMSESYNRKPFLLSHRLSEHPQFELPSLFALCRRLGTGQVLCRIGKVPVDAEFDTSLQRYNQGLRLDEALENLEEKQAYIAIYNPEQDPEYRPVIVGLLGEIAAFTEPIEPGMNWYSTYIFISAQDSITPYHMDREMNFLLQVRGNKTVKLWDPLDEEIMTPAQRERLLSHIGGRPTYQPSFEAKAMVFELEPGLGVHHPFIAPHLVHTGSALSISLAITFRTRRSDIWTNANRFNQRFRRLGFEPTPVGRSPLLDQAKSTLLTAYQRARQVARRGLADTGE